MKYANMIHVLVKNGRVVGVIMLGNIRDHLTVTHLEYESDYKVEYLDEVMEEE